MGKKELETAIIELGLTIESEFIPYSQSRNASRQWKSLNWRITLRREGTEILRTEYSCGVAHAPAYAAAPANERDTSKVRHAVDWQIENGRTRQVHGAPILPDRVSVIAGIASDADALEFASFEQFASERGHDLDSRKAEAAYNACIRMGIALRAAVGEVGLQKLRVAREDY